LGTAAVDEVRRRVQQQIHGHCGRKGDPLYGIRTILRCGAEKLTDRQRARLERAIAADERHDEVSLAWQCTQELRSAYRTENLTEGRRIAEKILASFPTCRAARPARRGAGGGLDAAPGLPGAGAAGAAGAPLARPPRRWPAGRPGTRRVTDARAAGGGGGRAEAERKLATTQTALEIMGKAHALLEQISESAEPEQPRKKH
jgi:hypothetical protein